MSEELLEACKKGNLLQVKNLLTDKSNLVNIHHKDHYGNNGLMIACKEGRLDVVKYLLTSKELKEHAKIHEVMMLSCTQLFIIIFILFNICSRLQN